MLLGMGNSASRYKRVVTVAAVVDRIVKNLREMRKPPVGNATNPTGEVGRDNLTNSYATVGTVIGGAEAHGVAPAPVAGNAGLGSHTGGIGHEIDMGTHGRGEC